MVEGSRKQKMLKGSKNMVQEKKLVNGSNQNAQVN